MVYRIDHVVNEYLAIVREHSYFTHNFAHIIDLVISISDCVNVESGTQNEDCEETHSSSSCCLRLLQDAEGQGAYHAVSYTISFRTDRVRRI